MRCEVLVGVLQNVEVCWDVYSSHNNVYSSHNNVYSSHNNKHTFINLKIH